MKYDFVNIDNEDRGKWDKICPQEEYRIYTGDEVDQLFVNLLPPELYSKFTSVLVVSSSTDNGKVYFMLNGNRIDNKDKAIDQMPFGFAFIGDSVSGSGCLIQHGSWFNRTIKPTTDFWSHIATSGSTNWHNKSTNRQTPDSLKTDRCSPV